MVSARRVISCLRLSRPSVLPWISNRALRSSRRPRRLRWTMLPRRFLKRLLPPRESVPFGRDPSSRLKVRKGGYEEAVNKQKKRKKKIIQGRREQKACDRWNDVDPYSHF